MNKESRLIPISREELNERWGIEFPSFYPTFYLEHDVIVSLGMGLQKTHIS